MERLDLLDAVLNIPAYCYLDSAHANLKLSTRLAYLAFAVYTAPMEAPDEANAKADKKNLMYLDGRYIDLGDASDPDSHIIHDIIIFALIWLPLLFIWWLLS